MTLRPLGPRSPMSPSWRPGRRICFVVVLSIVASGPAAQDTPVAPGDADWSTQLKSQDLETRRRAAIETRSADELTQVRILPVLIELLTQEKDGQVRLAVLETITDMGPAAKPAVPALWHSLRTDSGGNRQEESHQDYRAALALAAVGQPAVAGLRSLLSESPDKVRAGVRAEAAMALGRIGPAASDAVPDLIRQLGDENERVQEEASRALGRIGPAALDPLVRATHHEEAAVRARAISAIGQMAPDDRQAVDAVITATTASEPQVRVAAIRALANLQISGQHMKNVLVSNLRHGDETVRTAALNVLVSQRELLAQLKPELVGLLNDDDDGVAWHAAFLLQETGLSAAPDLLAAARHKSSRVEQIAKALAYIGRPAVDLLATACDDPEPRVRQAACLALGQIRPLSPPSVQLLTKGLKDPDKGVQSACLRAIGELGPLGRDAAPAIRTQLADESVTIRELAIGILFKTAPRDAQLMDDLIAVSRDPDPRVRRKVVDTITATGPLGRRALPVVVTLLSDPDPEVTAAAAAMIGSHGPAAAEAVPALVRLLEGATPELRLVVAQTLARLGDAAIPAWDQLITLLADENAEVRTAAVQTIGNLNLDPDRLRPWLVTAFQDPDEAVRSQAFRVVRRLGRRGTILIPDLIRLVSHEAQSSSVQRALERYEEYGADPRSLPELIELLDHDDPAVALLAIKFIRLAGPDGKAAVPALQRLSTDSTNEEVRARAAEAIVLFTRNLVDWRQTRGNCRHC